MDVGTKNEWMIDEVLTGTEMRSLLIRNLVNWRVKRIPILVRYPMTGLKMDGKLDLLNL